MQQTNQYQFNLIEPGDSFSPQPLNENMEKVEEALANVESSIRETASSCTKLLVGSYSGSDSYGKNAAKKLTADFKPQVVLILRSTAALHSTYGASLMLIRPNASGCVDNNYNVAVTWDENSVSWYSEDSPVYHMNTKGWTYYYFMLG